MDQQTGLEVNWQRKCDNGKIARAEGTLLHSGIKILFQVDGVNS